MARTAEETRIAKTEWARRWRAEHPDEARARDRKYRLAHPERCAESKRRCYAKHAEQNRAYSREWAKRRREADPDGAGRKGREWLRAHPDQARRYRHAWISRSPEARKAHQAANNAMASGKLVRQPCEVCGATTVHAHHDDYSKPLVVRWLCPAHHRAHHKATDKEVS